MSTNKNFLMPFKYFSLFAVFILLFCSATLAQKVRLRAKITPACTQVRATTGWRFADIFGDGNIAVQGSYGCNGAFIYDVTNPDAPVLASHYNPGNNQQFLEAIVIGNRGYFGSGIGNGGVHIVDLTNPYSPVFLGAVNSTNGGYNTIHEMMVVDQGGARYLIENSNSTPTIPIRIIDVTNPVLPVLKSSFSAASGGWIHAIHIRGNRMYTSEFTQAKIEIRDISNLASTSPPPVLGTITSNTTNHSSWTSEDGRYLYSARETFDGDIRVYDVQNAASPLLVRSIKAGDLDLNAVTPHNPVVMGNFLYVAWYQAGIQVFDLTDPADPKHVGQYDTFQPAYTPPSEEERQTLEEAGQPWDIVCGSGPAMSRSLPTNYNGNWAVYPFLGQNKVLGGDLTNGLFVLDATEITSPLNNRVSDFDGDGKTDLSVFRPTDGNWQIRASAIGATSTTAFGVMADIITPGDFDGDGATDMAIYRPSTGTWWIRRSSDPSNFQAVQFGLSTDIPVAADYDADGRTDIAVWRPSSGAWYLWQSTLGLSVRTWGLGSDKPVTGDFEGDGKADLAVWRPSNGVWYILQSSSSIPKYALWGTNGDRPLSADFDGNGVSDYAVYRPSNGTWYVLDPATGATRGYAFGISTDIPIPADYDGDAKTDVAVFRPGTNEWFRINSTNGSVDVQPFGQAGDRPSPSSVQPQ
jgi:hypothetical protein